MKTNPTMRGFTLIELIVVVMLLGIMAVGTVRFLNDAAEGFQSGTERTEVAAKVRQSVQHISHALREALPNSVRVSASGDCVEFIPIISATTYLSAPIGYSSDELEVVPFDTAITSPGWRVAVVPIASSYSLASPGGISPVSTAGVPDADNVVTIQLASAHQFSAASPQQRAFAVANPVSYCLQNETLYRYQNYGFNAVQPSVAALPTSLPSRSKLVAGVAQLLPVFTATDATLTRNAWVAINLDFNQGDAQLEIRHGVQVRNQI